MREGLETITEDDELPWSDYLQGNAYLSRKVRLLSKNFDINLNFLEYTKNFSSTFWYRTVSSAF